MNAFYRSFALSGEPLERYLKAVANFEESLGRPSDTSGVVASDRLLEDIRRYVAL